ncbi:lipase member M-like [Ixodes scapularis]
MVLRRQKSRRRHSSSTLRLVLVLSSESASRTALAVETAKALGPCPVRACVAWPADGSVSLGMAGFTKHLSTHVYFHMDRSGQGGSSAPAPGKKPSSSPASGRLPTSADTAAPRRRDVQRPALPRTRLCHQQEATRNFAEGPPCDPLTRAALLLPWEPCDLTHVDCNQAEPSEEFLRSGRKEESLPDTSVAFGPVPTDRKLKVFSEYRYVNEHLTHPSFELTDDEREADILWYNYHFKNYGELSREGGWKRVNQFPFEHVLTVKDLLALVCRRDAQGGPTVDPATLATLPAWLPTTYNLKTELPQFVSYFQQRQDRGLDNHWICKPWNLARSLDTHVTDNLHYILRLPSTGPKVACKYITDPVLFPRSGVGLVKFDFRYVVLLLSVQPLRLFAYRNFWLRFANKDCGISFTKLTNLFGGLNAPPPMHVKSYQKIAAKVHDAAMQAASDAMRDAAQAVRDAQPTGNPSAGSDRLDVCISYDGTWHKRGHTSHFGVGVAIELETGLVLDFSVQSKYCHGCELGPKEDDEHFEEWAETHKATCQKNYEGSSNAMEVQAAATIFSRSIELHNVQELSREGGWKRVNQFPFEHVLTVKDLLALVCRRDAQGGPTVDPATLATLPAWLPTTYNLKTELPQFVSYFQQRQDRGLDNHWICKPWNLARSLDTHVTDNLHYILRLPSTGPKVACKYVTDPVLFPRGGVGLVKFDFRYVVLLLSVQPLRLFAYRNFWLRFANKPFALADFDDYEKHFTVMNYTESGPQQVTCAEFTGQFDSTYPSHPWASIQVRDSGESSRKHEIKPSTASSSCNLAIGCFLLADSGYDVWLGNFRGTPYANRHVEYQNTDGRYWNFSLDEVGLYDFPALVDFVLAATGKSSLFFVGFSQGNTAAWVMLADRPAYNHKIRLLMALAPVANMSFIRSPIRFLVPVSPVLTEAAITFNRGRLLVRSETTKRLFYNLCETPLRFVCSLPTFFLFGVNLNQLNESRLPVYSSHIPSGASKRNVEQFAQIIRARNFVKYDHGTGGNIARYGQPTSPAYDLARITAPVALFSSVGDYFANPRDVGTLRKSLPNVVFDYVVPEPGFVHLDFVLGTGAARAVYGPLIELMRRWAVGMQ